uniref:Solute carrier family 35 member A1 n=1 Tax=Taeniopygia guttata TaxID=59729 RepID=A0A674HCG2_TAEGU
MRNTCVRFLDVGCQRTSSEMRRGGAGCSPGYPGGTERDSMVRRGRRGALGGRAALYGAMGGAAGHGGRPRPGGPGAFGEHHDACERETGSLTKLITSLKENVFGSAKELLKLSVPSVVYAVQNNMAFMALSNLDAAVYQVTYQLKIPCTALCTVLMLNRTLSKLQWFSVFMLCGGVILVQWEPAQATKVQVEQNPWLGFGAIAVAVFCSGFAGVYFEKVLKSSDTSLWVRNIQLYLSGIVVNLFVVYMSDGAKILEKGFFYGYTYYVWFVVLLASVGGLYTSVVVKYTDNIMKGFSAAAAIVLSTVASVILFGLQISKCLFTFDLMAVLVSYLPSLLHTAHTKAIVYAPPQVFLVLTSVLLQDSCSLMHHRSLLWYTKVPDDCAFKGIGALFFQRYLQLQRERTFLV